MNFLRIYKLQALLLFGLFIALPALSQKHEWAFRIDHAANGGVYIQSQTIDDQDNVYLAVSSNSDSVYFSNDTIDFTAGPAGKNFIVKFDSDGNYVWSQRFYGNSVHVTQMLVNSSGSLLLFGYYMISPTVSFGTYSLTRTRAAFLATMDAQGNFTSAKDLAYTPNTGIMVNSAKLDNQDNIYVSLSAFGYNYLGTYTLNDSTTPTNVTNKAFSIVKLSKTGNVLLWSKSYSNADVLNYSGGVLDVDKDNEVYISFRANRSRTIHSINTGSDTALFLVWLRPNGAFHKAVVPARSNTSIDNIVATDSNNIVVTGTSTGDSFTMLGSTVISSDSDPKSTFHYLGRISKLSSLVWSQASNHEETKYGYPAKVAKGDLFTYVSMVFIGDTFEMAGFKHHPGPTTRSIVAKFDTLGNMLWILPLENNFPADINVLKSNELVYSGRFRTSITLNPFNLTTVPGLHFSIFGAFVAKTYDYSITRGEVSPGPYCAGDSIKIPFTKEGIFDTSNYFIAELSDENGLFLGKHRELGRLKTDRDSAVIGKLPLLKVASSPNYRIRIRSTSPSVQSFYKKDTLKLLIYSTDKADPGPDTSICFGDTLQLNTFGGTAWKWSPYYNMDDSTLRNPYVHPDTNQVYQIIISDSSGCGAPDTASVKVSILPSPKIRNIGQSDTAVCFNGDVTFWAEFEDGIADYTASWYYDYGGGFYKFIEREKAMKGRDSMTIPVRTSRKIMLLLTDSCSSKLDTAYFYIKLKSGVSQFEIPGDTSICYGGPTMFRAKAKHLEADSFYWSWINESNDTLSYADTAILSLKKDEIFRVRLYNACNEEFFVDSFRVRVFDSLNTQVLNKYTKDTFCRGQWIDLSAITTGGNPSKSRKYKWSTQDKFTDSTLYLLSDSLNPNVTTQFSSHKIYIRAEDGCTQPFAQDSIEIKLRPALQQVANNHRDTIACLGNKYLFNNSSSGGLGYPFLKYKWEVEGKVLSTDSFILFEPDSFIGKGSIELLSIVSDGCSTQDTLIYMIQLPAELKVSLLPQETRDTIAVCHGKKRQFTAEKEGGREGLYELSWQIDDSPFLFQDTLNLQFNKHNTVQDTFVKVKVRLTDDCSGKVAWDSLVIKISNDPVISFFNDSLNRGQENDTILCFGETLDLIPQTFYGEKNQVTWSINGISQGIGSSLEFNPSLYSLSANSTYLIQAVVTDNCSRYIDSAILHIRVLDSLQLEPIADSTLCFGENLELVGRATGGKPLDYAFTWTNKTGGVILSSDSNISLTSLNQDLVLLLTVTDHCSTDTAEKEIGIHVRAPIEIALSSPDTCFTNNALISSTAKGGIASDYEYEWLENGTKMSDISSSISVTPLTTSKYQLILKDNCSTPSDTATLFISPKPKFVLTSLDTIVCEPFQLLATANSLNGESYFYTVEDIKNNRQNGLNPGLLFLQGVYPLRIMSETSTGCRDTQKFSLRVKPLPDPAFSWDPQNPDYDRPDVHFEASKVNLDLYRWYMNAELISEDFTAQYTFKDTGTYTIRLEVSKDGCIKDSSMLIVFRDNYRNFNASAFSPNGDGLNDVYKPTLSGVEKFNYQIFNRWGEVIYEGDHKAEGWDGTYMGKESPQGVYNALAWVLTKDKVPYFYSFSITLLR